ncbi:EF hand family protein [Histomonas meleagridis]|uniref:EF hand family protein n=1 Tax=Histomonas meleagridis TaxID=135588 RepID=UPI00355ACC61|nr:EF hand family protein [Histomonas meleagridis]KAH0801387.1 EF hand family protein [Histomonas meleagridis]
MGSEESTVEDELDSNTAILKKLEKKGVLFKPQEVIQLMDVYRDLAGTNNLNGEGSINEDEFIKKLRIGNERVGKLMYKLLDEDGNGTISFEEFVMGLNFFLPDAPIDVKSDLCFRAYDEDGGGTISKDEVQLIIEMSLEGNTLMHMDNEQLLKLVDDLFDEFDTSGKGELSKEDFFNIVKGAPNILDFLEFDVASLKSNA